ncbi:MAG TPA: MFS transporter [Chloroflexota bacterium]|nr:MFS transporter [Chloroflexota bacterium]
MSSPPGSESRPPATRPGLASLRDYFLEIGRFERNAKLFLTVTAFRGLVIASLQTVLNLYLYSLGYDTRFIGLISAANSLATLLFSFPAGYLADRVGRRPVLLVGGIGYPLAILGLGLVRTTPPILLFNFLFGCFAVAYWVAGVPLLYASTAPRQRVQAFSVNSFLLWGLGPLGALGSGQVVEITAAVLQIPASSSGALRAGMFFMAALALLGALPYLPMREERSSVRRDAAQSTGPVAGLFARLLIPDLALALGAGGVLTFAQLYFHLRFYLDPGPIGVIVALGGITAGAATLTTPVLARRWGNLRTAVRCDLMVVPLIAVMALSFRLPLAIPAYWLVLAFRGMNDPAYTSFIQERVPETYRARLTGLYSITYSIGASLGPAGSGQIQKVGGFTPAFMAGAGCYLLGAALLYAFFGREARFGNPASLGYEP